MGAELAGVAAINTPSGQSSILIAPFDYKAAFELAVIDRGAIGAGDKRDGQRAPWQKIKIDRQIVAIGRSTGCELIVSKDDGVHANALRVGIRAIKVVDLDIPDSARQHSIPFDEPQGRAARKSTRSRRLVKGTAN